ncbi:MAG: aldose 1-epimerase family protein [Clostridia bacterium]|nr:aldose 1-epimerase family protein [Clostridia bacterium]
MIYTIENEYLKISVNSLGAQLFGIYSKKSGKEYLWQGDEKYWVNRAPNLFPIVGRLWEGKYTYQGKTYEMNTHGFSRNRQFALCDKTETAMTFALSYDEETLKIYPFEFIFKVSFALEGSSLKVLYRVENKGEGDMYFGLGAHPGFNVPFDGGNFDDYYIEFENSCSPELLLLGEHYLLSGEKRAFPLENGKIIRLKHSIFDEDALILQGACRSLKIKSKGGKSISVVFPKMTYLGIWHKPKSDAPYVCIEPWENLPSFEGKTEDLTQKANVGKIGSYESYESGLTIGIEE